MKTNKMFSRCSTHSSENSSARDQFSSRLDSSPQNAGKSLLHRLAANTGGWKKLAKLSGISSSSVWKYCVWAFCVWFVFAPVVAFAAIDWAGRPAGATMIGNFGMGIDWITIVNNGDPNAGLTGAWGNLWSDGGGGRTRLTVNGGCTGSLNLTGNFAIAGDVGGSITVNATATLHIQGITNDLNPFADIYGPGVVGAAPNNWFNPGAGAIPGRTFGINNGAFTNFGTTNFWNINTIALANGTFNTSGAGTSVTANQADWFIGGGSTFSNTSSTVSGRSWWVDGTFTNAGSGTINTIWDSIPLLPLPLPPNNVPRRMSTLPTWVFRNATFNLGTEAARGGTINLAVGGVLADDPAGHMWIWNTTTNFTGDSFNFYDWDGKTAQNAVGGASTINNGTVFFSANRENFARVPSLRDFVNGYNRFTVRGVTGGTADLRFLEYATPAANVLPLPLPDNTPAIDPDLPLPLNPNDGMRYLTDNRVLMHATENAQIANPHIYLEGTFGRVMSNIDLLDNLPNQNNINGNLMYNVVRVTGEDNTLGITSNIKIARINPERRDEQLVDLNHIDPAAILEGRPIGWITDVSWFLNNPNGNFYLAGQNNQQTYNAKWNPINNPNSTYMSPTYYAPLDARYDAYYDPAAAVHKPGTGTYKGVGYNSIFDKFSSSYNPATAWETVDALTSPFNNLNVTLPAGFNANIIPISLNAGLTTTTGRHIAYNPYLDMNGYSGGWTKVDNGTLWIQTVQVPVPQLPQPNTRDNQLERDINSLIDVQSGMLRFNRQQDLRPVYQVERDRADIIGEFNLNSEYAFSEQYNFNPNGLIYKFYDGAGALKNTIRDETNYYTIQLNIQNNAAGAGANNTSILSTSGGRYYNVTAPTITVAGVTRNADLRLVINNRIILLGGGAFEVGFAGQAGNQGLRPTDDDAARPAYFVAHNDLNLDNNSRWQGGGVGPHEGYLWLRGATLVLSEVVGNIKPEITKTGTGTLDLTGVLREKYVNSTFNVQSGTLAFTNPEDIGTGDVVLNGRQSILAILTDSTLDRNYQRFDGDQVIAGSVLEGVEIIDPRRSVEEGWWKNGIRYAMNPDAGETRLSNTIRFENGGTINVVQGGEAAAYQNPAGTIFPSVFAQPFFSDADISKVRVNDGYHNQHNLILGKLENANGQHQIEGNGPIRKIGLGKLTIEGNLPAGITGWEIQRGTLSFAKQENLGNGLIRFTLDKNATLQYMGTRDDNSLNPYTVTLRNNIFLTYDTTQTTRGGATFDIRDTVTKSTDPTPNDLTENSYRLVTLKLLGDITGNRNLLTLTKIGQHRSILDISAIQTRQEGVGGQPATWDIRTGELAFNIQGNIGGGEIRLFEATTLHKLYLPVAGNINQGQFVDPADVDRGRYMRDVNLINTLSVINNATLIVDEHARLTLSGNLNVTNQFDKLGKGTLVLNGSLAKIDPKDAPGQVTGGLRIKEGNLEFSHKKNITTVNGRGIDISLYGKDTGIIYNGMGDVVEGTVKPNPMVINSNINILNNGDISPERIANITVTHASGNIQIAGEKLRGGNLTVNDLERGKDGYAELVYEPVTDTWIWNAATPIVFNNVNSTLVKKGLGTLTLTGILNNDAGESISLTIEQGKIAFGKVVADAQNNLGANIIILKGTGATLEYLGAAVVPSVPITIANPLQLENGGGTLSVAERGAIWTLGNQVTVNQTSDSQTWTLAKTGAGILDVSAVNFAALAKVGSAATVALKKLDIQNGVVRTGNLANLGTAQISMGTATSTGILDYTGNTGADTLTNQIILAGIGGIGGGGINVSNLAAPTLELKGAITGTGNFTKGGVGTLEIGKAAGNGYYSGDFIVEKGNVNFTGGSQKFSGKLSVTDIASKVTVSASNTLSASNSLHLIGGSQFVMEDTATPAKISQTLAGVYTYGAPNGQNSKVIINDNILTLTNTAGGTATWRAGQVTGAEGSTLTLNGGYLIADLTNFKGTFNYLGGGGVIDTSKVPVDPDTPNINPINWSNQIWDKDSWISGDVTLTNNSHITVGHNPSFNTSNAWASDNISLTNSTVDIAGTFLTSELFIASASAKNPNVALTNSRISVQENWNESGNIALTGSALLVGGKWQHFDATANGGLGGWVDGLWNPTLNGGQGGYEYNPAIPDTIQWSQDIANGAAVGNFNAVNKSGNPSSVSLSNNSVAQIRGNWNSGAVTVNSSDVTVGHITTAANGAQFLTADTGEFNTNGQKVTISGNSTVTAYGAWKSGDIAMNSSEILVGVWGVDVDGNPTPLDKASMTLTHVDAGNIVTGGSLIITGTNNKLRVAGDLNAGIDNDPARTNSITATNTDAYIGGALFAEKVTMTNSDLKVDGSVQASESFTMSGTNTKRAKLTIGGAMNEEGGNFTAGSVTLTSTDATIATSWNSGNVKTSNSNINIGEKWTTTGNIDTSGGLITIKDGLDAAGAVSSNATTWTIENGGWKSTAVDIKNSPSIDVTGNWNSPGVSLFSNVSSAKITGGMITGDTRISSTDNGFNFSVGNNWTAARLTAQVTNTGANTATGNLAIGGDFTSIGKVYTDGVSWNVTGNFNAVSIAGIKQDTTIANALQVKAANWDSGDTTLKNVANANVNANVNITNDWTSTSLELNAPKMTMTIGGNFTPGNSLKLYMQPGMKVNAEEFVYNISAANVILNPNTPLSVLGTESLGLGKYNVARITGNITGNNLLPQQGLFKNIEAAQNADNANMFDITLDVKGFTGYLEKLSGGLTRNQLAVASNISRMEQNILAFENAPMAMNAQSTSIPSSLRDNRFYTDVVQPLIKYGDTATTAAEMAFAANTINNILTQVAGETYANSMSLLNHRPWMSAYDRTRMDNAMYFAGSDYVSSQQQMRGQVPLARMNRIWITPEYSFDAIASDDNARAADINRMGFSFGMDRRIRQNATAGLLFGYNAGRLKQVEDRFQASDFQIGLYTSAMVGYYIEMRGYLGCGWQTHESNRIVDLTSIGGNRLHAAGKSDGSSVSGSLEAARPLFFGLFIMKPTMGIDFGTYVRDAFTETGDEAIRLRVDRTTYTRVAPRIGATWESGTMSKIAVSTRLFFGYNLGDEYVDTKLQNVGLGGGVNSMQIRSSTLGRAFIDAGIGSRYFVNESRSLSLHANADIISSRRSLAGAFSIGAGWMF